MIIARELGYEVTVTNASDKRNKGSVEMFIKTASYSTSIDSYYGKNSTSKKRVIIMDEVDGMGKSDKGGIAELIKVIKTTLTPIICIVNDRQHKKIRSLANYCYDLPFARPVKGAIVKRMQEILKKERGGGRYEDSGQLEALVEASGNDIR